MNIFFNNYSDDKCQKNSKNSWKEFGYEQLEKLYYYLGYPKDINSKKDIRANFKYAEYKKGFILQHSNTPETKLFYIIN